MGRWVPGGSPETMGDIWTGSGFSTGDGRGVNASAGRARRKSSRRLHGGVHIDLLVEEYVRECWELDALDPSVIQGVVETAIEDQISDREAFQARKERRSAQRERLKEVSDRWPEPIADEQ